LIRQINIGVSFTHFTHIYLLLFILKIPLPKFPPLVIALIPNHGSDKADDIAKLHFKLLDNIAPRLELHLLSFGSDGAIVEFQSQQQILNANTTEKLSIHEDNLNIHFSCPVFEQIGPVVRVQDPKHAKKTARNAAISGARLLTFGNTSVQYSNFLQLINRHDSVMFKNNVIKLDR
jgi:hypothetical protein